ncbi:MAG: P pilus assembly protein, chaperone PapD [Cyanobacteria bacterium SBLK]|nr:P pilus assembly protein, chaperone PapD [Cyanobacteria bacterium SBLK]
MAFLPKKQRFLRYLSGFLFGLSAWLGHSLALAQLGVSPIVLEIQARRGQSQGFISIYNTGNEPYRARVYAQPFTYDRDRGFQTLPETPLDLTPYLQFTPRELVVQPGQNRRVRLIGRFPPSLAEGEYRTALMVEGLDPITIIDGAGNTLNIVQRIAATVFVRNGELEAELVVDRAFWNPQTRQITILVQNLGGASARPGIEWLLLQAGTEIDRGQISPEIILAGGDRHLAITYAEGEEIPAPGTYQLQGELVWHENNYRRQNQESFQIDLIVE